MVLTTEPRPRPWSRGGLAIALDVPPPASAAERRQLWQRVEVSTDEISGTVITYGLRPPGGSC